MNKTSLSRVKVATSCEYQASLLRGETIYYIALFSYPFGPPWTQSWVPTGSLNRSTTTLFRGGWRGKASFFTSEEDSVRKT